MSNAIATNVPSIALASVREFVAKATFEHRENDRNRRPRRRALVKKILTRIHREPVVFCRFV